jgi:hypothetical protein
MCPRPHRLQLERAVLLADEPGRGHVLDVRTVLDPLNFHELDVGTARQAHVGERIEPDDRVPGVPIGGRFPEQHRSVERPLQGRVVVGPRYATVVAELRELKRVSCLRDDLHE